ncbi:hypothetical protein QO207_25825 [Pseudomonas sp. CAN2814]|uniref:hypothetical protein n=1 Tax=Pseudomonas sp. CAN1 TaxID=3046726 RepID=UPI00264978AF|nr:hypothetical protein [Pseudomonas sp. CAN1]MDN6860022.1 hypothetical protein [Pseudomonas sp. CAN1]
MQQWFVTELLWLLIPAAIWYAAKAIRSSGREANQVALYAEIERQLAQRPLSALIEEDGHQFRASLSSAGSALTLSLDGADARHVDLTSLAEVDAYLLAHTSFRLGDFH